MIIVGGYPLLFLIVILEGIPLIGTIVPGHITIIAAGFLARTGFLDLGLVLLIATIGALLGDCIGFFLGKKYGMTLIDYLRPYFYITDSHIKKAQDLLLKHTGKAMIIGRFSPATRALMPFLVGSSQMSVGRFWLFNIISGVSWVALSVFLGYVFGAGYHLVSQYFGRFVVIAIIVAIVIVWGYRFVNIRFHIFRRYELFTLALNILSLWALASVVDQLIDQKFVLGFDVWVSAFMDTLHESWPFVATIASWVSTVGGTLVTGTLGIALGLWFLIRKKWRSALVMLGSVISTGIAVGFLKEFFMSPRPSNALEIIVNDPSFPSGHTALATAFFFAFAYLFVPRIYSQTKRELTIVFCVFATIAIGLSRLVLNVHWASDVITGWSLGVFLTTAIILLVRYIGILVVGKKEISTHTTLNS